MTNDHPLMEPPAYTHSNFGHMVIHPLIHSPPLRVTSISKLKPTIIMAYSEQDISDATKAIENGTSITRAARDFGIPQTTLHRRLRRGRTHHPLSREQHQAFSRDQQRLTPAQEEDLARWVTTQRDLGVRLTHAQVREFAQRTLVLQGDTQPLGKAWIYGFVKRNPSMQAHLQRKVLHRAAPSWVPTPPKNSAELRDLINLALDIVDSPSDRLLFQRMQKDHDRMEVEMERALRRRSTLR